MIGPLRDAKAMDWMPSFHGSTTFKRSRVFPPRPSPPAAFDFKPTCISIYTFGCNPPRYMPVSSAKGCMSRLISRAQLEATGCLVGPPLSLFFLSISPRPAATAPFPGQAPLRFRCLHSLASTAECKSSTANFVPTSRSAQQRRFPVRFLDVRHDISLPSTLPPPVTPPSYNYPHSRRHGLSNLH